MSSISVRSADQLSLLELLLRPLFIEVCSFLHLEEKCTALYVLSKVINEQIKQTINQSMRNAILINWDYHHCTNTLEPQVELLNQRCEGLLPYIQYASHLSLGNILNVIDYSLAASIKEKVKIALFSGCLHGLSIHGPISASLDLFSGCQSVNSFKLRTLSLLLFGNDNGEFDHFEWSYLCAGLNRCIALTKLDIEFPDPSWPTELLLSEVMNSLPCTIEELTLTNVEHFYRFFSSLFESATFLPHLKVLSFPNCYGSSDLAGVIASIASTVMVDTGFIRPITQWALRQRVYHQAHPVNSVTMTDTLSVIRHFDLHTLNFWDLDESIFAMLALCPQDMFPNLTSLSVQCDQQDCEAAYAVMNFASRRALTQLVLGPVEHSFSKESLQMLSDMSSLRCLAISTRQQPFSGCDDLTDVFAGGCWPHLESLYIQTTSLNELQLGPLLCAAPQLQHVEIRPSGHWKNTGCSCPMMFAMILSLCPRLQFVQVEDASPSYLHDYMKAFDRYPLDESKVQHLMYIKVADPSYSAVKYLCQVLSVAPILYGVDFNLDAKFDAERFPLDVLSTVSSLRQLPHLRSFHGLYELLLAAKKWTTEMNQSDWYDTLRQTVQPRLSRWTRFFNSKNMCERYDHIHSISAVDYEQYVPFLRDGQPPWCHLPTVFRSSAADFFSTLEKLSRDTHADFHSSYSARSSNLRNPHIPTNLKPLIAQRVVSSRPQSTFASTYPIRNILVVENNPVNNKIVGLMMKKLGFSLLSNSTDHQYRVSSVDNGDLAVEWVHRYVQQFIEEHSSASQTHQPDSHRSRQFPCLVILMDAREHMDSARNGIDATRAIRSSELIPARYQPYVIAMTMHDDHRTSLSSDMDAFLSKPIHFKTLTQRLEDVLTKSLS